MKPFNLEEFVNGAPAIQRGETDLDMPKLARFVYYNKELRSSQRVGYSLDGSDYLFTLNEQGVNYLNSDYDLIGMYTETVTKYVAVYGHEHDRIVSWMDHFSDTREEAMKCVAKEKLDQHLYGSAPKPFITIGTLTYEI